MQIDSEQKNGNETHMRIRHGSVRSREVHEESGIWVYARAAQRKDWFRTKPLRYDKDLCS